MTRQGIRLAGAAAIALILLLGAGQSAHAAVLVADSFTVGDGTGTAGADLNGTFAEIGGVAWVAETSIDFQANNTVKRIGSVGNNVAVAPVTPDPAGPIYKARASVIVEDSGNTANFLGFGFTDNTDLAPFWNTGGAELWVHMRANGAYEAFAKGTSITMVSNGAAGSAPGFVSGGLNTFEVQYLPATNRATVLINGTTVVNNFNLTAFAFTPNIGAAGFFFQANQSAADSFVAIVPEPATGGVLALALASLSRRRRR